MNGIGNLVSQLSWADALPVLLGGVACVGLHKAENSDSESEPLDKKQGLAWRGLFACVVVLFHLASEYDKTGILFPRFEYWGPLPVAVFFGFSGYGTFVQLFGGGNEYFKHFWRRRLPAVWGPYALFGGVSLLQWWRGDWDIWKRIADQLGVVEYGWFAAVLTGYYAAFWWGNRGGRAGSVEGMALTLFGVMAMTAVLDVASVWVPNGGIHWYVSNGALVTGALLGWRPSTAQQLVRKYLGVILALGVLGVALHSSYALYGAIAGHETFRFLYNSFAVVVLAGVGMKWHLGNGALRWLGKISYELYLAHGWVMWEMRHWFPNLNGSGYVWAVFVASLVLAEVTHLLWSVVTCVMDRRK